MRMLAILCGVVLAATMYLFIPTATAQRGVRVCPNGVVLLPGNRCSDQKRHPRKMARWKAKKKAMMRKRWRERHL